jgi:hypothetical protein
MKTAEEKLRYYIKDNDFDIDRYGDKVMLFVPYADAEGFFELVERCISDDDVLTAMIQPKYFAIDFGQFCESLGLELDLIL